MMFFRIFDDASATKADSRKRQGAIRIHRSEMAEWNAQGWGIFHTFQDYMGTRRLISEISQINAWYIEMDNCSKAEQESKIARSPLVPSMIVESKRSYHVYWWAINAGLPTWDAIVRDRLQPLFDSDKAATDPTRLLRVPGFLHQKDPRSPYRAELVHEHDVRYTERQMVDAFTDVGSSGRIEKLAKAQASAAARSIGDLTAIDFFERAFQLNCRAALLHLSGTPAVCGETIELHDNRSGTANIIVDGEGTSCWVDGDGHIGSSDGGGPGIAQWVNWYHKDYRQTRQYLLEAFPELKG